MGGFHPPLPPCVDCVRTAECENTEVRNSRRCLREDAIAKNERGWTSYPRNATSGACNGLNIHRRGCILVCEYSCRMSSHSVNE
jgi:hypothetical protein